MKTQILRFGLLVLLVTLLPFRGMGQALPLPQRVKSLGKTIKAPNGRYVNGKIIFFYEGQPWITDGTTNGTQLVKASPTNLVNAFAPYVLLPTVFNNAVYYYYVTSNSTYGFYRTDGTTDGTYRIIQSSIDAIGVLEDKLLLLAPDPADGKTALFVSDGTAAGTKKIKANLQLGGITSFYKIGNTLFFFTVASSNAQGLWKTDGTEAGTILVKEIPGSVSKIVSDEVRIFFDTFNNSTDQTIWRTDGTTAGTVQLPGIMTPNSFFLESIAGGHLLYLGNSQGNSLIATTTDQSSVTQISDKVIKLNSSIGNYGKTVSTFFFTASTSTDNVYMQTDGTLAGTKPVGVTPVQNSMLNNPQIILIQNWFDVS